MPTTLLRRVVAGALLGFVLGSAPVRAQLTVEPEALSVSVPQHETETRTVMLTNTDSGALTFCLSFDRPLHHQTQVLQLVKGRAGADAPCGEYGEVLYRFDEEDFGAGWDPYGVTMTPEGRLFTAELSGLHRTFEFTPELTLLRSFEHPFVAELTPFSGTGGVTYDAEGKSLWWMNEERQEQVTRRILLLEGDLNGDETGRRIELAPPEGPVDEFNPGGLSFDPATDLFYFTGQNGDTETRTLWAVNRMGTLAAGYPFRPEPYPPPALIGHPEAHGGAEGGPEGVRVEYGAYPPGSLGYDRVAVVDRWGNSEGEALETPVPTELFEGNGAGIRANPLRSRIDPNGVMYMTFSNFDHRGIVGVRPHPLPPSWLMVDSGQGPEAAWDGELAPGESRELLLTFRAGAREVGDYTASLQVFEAATGEAVEVPLALSVTPGTDTEEEAAPEEASGFSVYPNPASGEATVALTLAEASEGSVVVYDVLGRSVAVLHEGLLAAGEHVLAFETRHLPAGLYLVRAEGKDFTAARRVTVAR